MLTVEETLILSGLAGFSSEYVPVFLAGNYVYKTQVLKRGDKNFKQQKLSAGIV